MIKYGQVIDKIKKVKGFRKEAEVAEMLGLSPPDFSARKKKGTLLPLIIDWAINDNINLDFLLKDGQNYIGLEVNKTECRKGSVIDEQIKECEAILPEPINKTIHIMLKNPDKAWEFYAMILERTKNNQDEYG